MSEQGEALEPTVILEAKPSEEIVQSFGLGGVNVKYLGERKIDDLILMIQVLGKGAFGSVFEGITKNDIIAPNKELIPKGTRVAVKEQQVMPQKIYLFSDEINSLRIAMEKNCGNIIKIYDILVDSSRDIYYMIMELVQGADLSSLMKQHFIRKRDYPKFETAFQDLLLEKIICPIMTGIKCLHDHGIAHRDIKLANLMYDKKKDMIKIIDLGLSCDMKVCSKRGIGGTPSTMAPELFIAQPDSQLNMIKTDLWSLGVVIYQLVTKQSYYRFNTLMANAYNRKDKIALRVLIKLYNIDEELVNVSDDTIKSLLKNLLLIDPNARKLDMTYCNVVPESAPLVPVPLVPESAPLPLVPAPLALPLVPAPPPIKQIKRIYDTLNSYLSTGVALKIPKGSPPQIPIWIHEFKYDEKYGMFYRLNDGTYGANLNDKTVISKNKSTQQYRDLIHQKEFSFTFEKYPAEIAKKVKIFKSFLDQVNKNIIKFDHHIGKLNEKETTSPVYVSTWLKTKEASFFRLSTSPAIIQISFTDKSGIILSSDGTILNVINNNGTIDPSIWLYQADKNNISLQKRLKYVHDVLYTII